MIGTRLDIHDITKATAAIREAAAAYPTYQGTRASCSIDGCELYTVYFGSQDDVNGAVEFFSGVFPVTSNRGHITIYLTDSEGTPTSGESGRFPYTVKGA